MIIENDKISLAYMKKMCGTLRPAWTLACTASDAATAMGWLSTHQNEVQLIISDIELDDGNCFDIFEKIDINTPIIFTTAFDEYVMKTFEQDNIDYLLKPIEPEALERAFGKFEKLQLNTQRQLVGSMMKVKEQLLHEQRYTDRILIPLGDKFWHIDVSQVAFFASEDKYVFANLFNGKRNITSFRSLNDVEAVLDPHDFFRVSRDILASIGSVKKVSRFFKGRLSAEICMDEGSQTIIISAERRNTFLDWLGK
jgi:two-component system, LytTR family, response regulator LytT